MFTNKWNDMRNDFSLEAKLKRIVLEWSSVSTIILASHWLYYLVYYWSLTWNVTPRKINLKRYRNAKPNVNLILDKNINMEFSEKITRILLNKEELL